MHAAEWVALAGIMLAFGIAIRQDWLTRRSNRTRNAIDLVARFMEPEAREARFAVRRIMADAAANGGFDDLPEKDRASLASISSLFGLASLLDDKDEIEIDVVMAAFGDSIVTNFERLSDYKLWRDLRHPGRDSLWRHFERAAAKARSRGYFGL